MESRYKQLKLFSDWKNYQLAIFNLVQNSVKYNMFKGDIIFIIRVLPLYTNMKKKCDNNSYSNIDSRQVKNQMNSDEPQINYNRLFELEIIDSGVGIDQESQHYLFIPFRELMIKQNIQKVKNNSIGMGLANAYLLIQQMHGQLALKESKRGRTIFKA